MRASGSYPLPRKELARLVEAVAAKRPKALGLDILLLDRGPPEGDAALVAALRETPTVIAAAAIFERNAGSRHGFAPVERMIWPQDAFRAVAGTGLVNIATDHAGTARHLPLLIAGEGAMLPAFALRLAGLSARADPVVAGDAIMIGGVTTRTDLGFTLPLRFYGPRGTIRTVSAGDVLAGRVPDEAVADRIAIIGTTAIGTGDTFATPFDPVLPGVEVLATAVGHLTSGDGLRRTLAERRIDAAATIVLPVLTVLLIALRRIAVGILVLTVVTATWAALTIVAFRHGSWLSMSGPIAGVVPPAVAYVLARLWLDQRIERRLKTARDTLRRFQPRALADHLARSPDFLDRPVRQQAGILFIDLSGFTGMSERLGPERTRGVLKDLHGIIEEEATRHRGLVISFMGDGAMIVFGLPAPDRSDARATIAAAISLAERVRTWLAAVADRGSPPLSVRVGAHYGPVIVSRLGAETHQHITATGDSVNVASRLLEVARQEHANVVLSADVVGAAGEPAVGGLGTERTVMIRGRREPLKVRLWSG